MYIRNTRVRINGFIVASRKFVALNENMEGAVPVIFRSWTEYEFDNAILPLSDETKQRATVETGYRFTPARPRWFVLFYLFSVPCIRAIYINCLIFVSNLISARINFCGTARRSAKQAAFIPFKIRSPANDNKAEKRKSEAGCFCLGRFEHTLNTYELAYVEYIMVTRNIEKSLRASCFGTHFKLSNRRESATPTVVG